jgi:hypothetical protein
LMRAGVLQLARWGLLDAIRAAGTPRIDLTTFHYGDRAVEIRIKPRDGVDALYAPRRTLLDPLLADAARASGAEVAYRVRLNELQLDGRGRVTGAVLESGGRARSIAAGIVIGADGANSTVAKRTGAETYCVGANRSATIYTTAKHWCSWRWPGGGSWRNCGSILRPASKRSCAKPPRLWQRPSARRLSRDTTDLPVAADFSDARGARAGRLWEMPATSRIPSRRTASPMRCATPKVSRGRS